MLEFLEQYGGTILAWVLAAGSLISAVYSLVNVFKLGKKLKQQDSSVQEKIDITQEGIIKAFQTAKLPNEIKVSLSTKVNEVLTEARDKLIEEVKKNEQLRTDMMAIILKILSFTAASNHLTDDEKKQIEDLINLVSNDDATIDV